jgi:hypothetical protein
VYSGETIKATIGIQSFLQHALGKAKLSNAQFPTFTDASMSAFLLSPFLVKERPSLFRISKAQAQIINLTVISAEAPAGRRAERVSVVDWEMCCNEQSDMPDDDISVPQSTLTEKLASQQRALDKALARAVL